MPITILLIGQEPTTVRIIRDVFGSECNILEIDNAHAALTIVRKHPASICFLASHLPDGSTLELLRQIKRIDETNDIVFTSNESESESIITALKMGADEFIATSAHPEILKAIVARLTERRSLSRENRLLKEEVRAMEWMPLFGKSHPAQQLLHRAIESAAGNEPILIIGEPGTEKEAIARFIHSRSSRARRPFVLFRCATHSSNQIDHRIFGRRAEHVQGRSLSQLGKIELAEDGVLYLEQADRLPLEIQAKIGRMILDPSNRTNHAMRLIASTSPLESALPDIWDKEFRHLFTDHEIAIPPLRARKKDIPKHIRACIERVCALSQISMKKIDRSAEKFFLRYTWPGNIRELEYTIDRMIISTEKETLGIEDIPIDIIVQQAEYSEKPNKTDLSLKEARRHFERQYIRKILEKTKGNQTKTAKALGLHRNTLLWKLRELKMRQDYRNICDRRRGKRGK